ncbi:Rossmann-fold NAD(P)-binding domain-containing protein [Prochlorothrix hollandica]|uniref:Short-chain dehydrogenase n=1 Tax=Prochlorothrix hollandica PCC 9006 = CALU 1027 TaxID=317619 RepID=A0A0M2PZ49_PROHO|nr:hypothetical protein [Prochlorothrix hollandica]KKI99671.1 hypothetical protein PROH_07195 [Prochlorothrix hollandica PCC 9006 = CALU 1027]
MALMTGATRGIGAASSGDVETEFAEKLYGDRAETAALYGRFPCLQPQDIAAAVVYILAQPPHGQIHDLLLRPSRQPT